MKQLPLWVHRPSERLYGVVALAMDNYRFEEAAVHGCIFGLVQKEPLGL
jgi:hypothetical protein